MQLLNSGLGQINLLQVTAAASLAVLAVHVLGSVPREPSSCQCPVCVDLMLLPLSRLQKYGIPNPSYYLYERELWNPGD